LVFLLGIGSVWMFCMVFVGHRPSLQFVAIGISVAAASGAVLLARWLLAAPPVVHAVTVMFSRMDDGDSFFVATCECGWVGDAAATEAECRAEALEHSPNVQPETEYPLGR
jgi:hypothetical protein